MMFECGCELLLAANSRPPTTSPTLDEKPSKATPSSGATATNSSETGGVTRPTGSDDSCAFVIVEVTLLRPLRKASIAPHIPMVEVSQMLEEMEQGTRKRECTGRGQLDRDWQSTVRTAANSLRRVPYYGLTDFCTFNRQLSETRTRVELTTSSWMDAAVYVNNNFVVEQFLTSDEKFEEMLMMAHACLMRTACDTLVGVDNVNAIDPMLRAARHARHLQDRSHAVGLYMQLVSLNQNDGDKWRELATCLRDVDKDWAEVCIDKSILLNPRHALTLLSKAGMVFEEDRNAAEPFFICLLALYPLWSTGLVIASAYYYDREMFLLADVISEFILNLNAQNMAENLDFPKAWEQEQGDWWDSTPLLPGMNRYYEAADLLLRIRALELAEACMSRALAENGESAAYFHLVALCSCLRGDNENAMCHAQSGLERYGEISFLRTLEAECYHRMKNSAAAKASFEKAGGCVGAYSIMISLPNRDSQRARAVLVDLVRRQPSAYAWMALAEDWMMRASTGEGGDAGLTEEQVTARVNAEACAVQALKWDRRAGRPWALLSKLVKPSARRLHCIKMAAMCGFHVFEDRVESSSPSQQSLCHLLGVSLRECHCDICGHMQF